MFDECLLYVAPEGVPHIDVMGGHLFVPADDVEFQQMAKLNGYELVTRDDERYSGCLRKAATAIYENEI